MGGSVARRPSPIGRARRLTDAEARALAAAVGWEWQPLALPGRGSFVAAANQALAAAEVAGRAGAAALAVDGVPGWLSPRVVTGARQPPTEAGRRTASPASLLDRIRAIVVQRPGSSCPPPASFCWRWPGSPSCCGSKSRLHGATTCRGGRGGRGTGAHRPRPRPIRDERDPRTTVVRRDARLTDECRHPGLGPGRDLLPGLPQPVRRERPRPQAGRPRAVGRTADDADLRRKAATCAASWSVWDYLADLGVTAIYLTPIFQVGLEPPLSHLRLFRGRSAARWR